MTKNDFLTQIGNRVDVVACEWEYDCMSQALDYLESSEAKAEYDYFYEKIAPHLLESSQVGAELLFLAEQSAVYVGMGKDVEPFVAENGNVLAHIGYRLPNINDEPSVKQSIFQQLQNTVAINKLLNEHIYHKDDYIETYASGNFHNGAKDLYHQMPLQGWKIHISANNLEDYQKLLETVLPEFNQQGVIYKVAAPDSFDIFTEGAQAGKHITVYLNENFDMSRFSPELQNVLGEQGMTVDGEMSLGGRMFARYGKFRERPEHELVCLFGGSTYDERGTVAPSWANALSSQQILSFPTICAEKFNMTGDYKAYVQEMFTMNSMAPNNYLYHTLEINPQDMQCATDLLSQHKSYSSFGSAVYELHGHAYIMVHENDKSLQRALDSENMKYIRPDWDCKCTMYFINPEHETLAREMIGQDREDISLERFQDGSVAVCVDSLIKEGSFEFMKSIDFESAGIQVLEVLGGQDHLFAIEQNRARAQDIDLTTPSFPDYEGFEWD